jgi:hypothetical protein
MMAVLPKTARCWRVCKVGVPNGAALVVIQAPRQNPCKQARSGDFGNQSLTKL